jgi:CRISPR-associated protein Cas1
MAWRGVHLTRPSRLSFSDKQIVVAQDDGEVRLPIEDVAWVILDTQQVSITGTLLAACMEAGIVMITCDAKHTPCGVAMPFHTHFRQPAIAEAQIAMSKPLKKRLWQAIVGRKIENQASVLWLRAPADASPIREMCRWVRSGDPDNIEARAARHYWPKLFQDFTRCNEADRRNKLLNYGYAIVRAAITRALVAAGFLPALGLHHASASNAFNLADDLIEPFRPFVDRAVMRLEGPETLWRDEPTTDDRRALAGLLLENAQLAGERVSLLIASEKTAESLSRAIAQKAAEALMLPKVPIIEEPDLYED